MPLYDYGCTRCGLPSESFARIADRNDPEPCECGGRREVRFSPPRVMSDIEPYQAVATDIATGKRPTISGRAAHREFLKRNGYVEVGNEQVQQREVPIPDARRDVKNAMERLGL